MIYRKEALANISFPLGGIGTGCIGLLGNGELSDFEVENRPSKNMRNGYTHFAVRATTRTGSDLRILHGDTNESYMGRPRRSNLYAGFGYGPSSDSLAGMPHFREVELDGRFPTAALSFLDPDFPGKVGLFAFNPFIPHREDDSGIPAAFFEVTLENTEDEPIEYAVALSTAALAEASQNEAFFEGGAHGILLGDASHTKDEIGYSELAILTDGDDCAAQEYWYRGGWMDGITSYYKDMSAEGRLPMRHYDTPGRHDHATLAVYKTVAPHSAARVRFVLSWNVPNAYNTYAANSDGRSWKNYYATRFASARESGLYALRNFSALLRDTLTFRDALHGSSLPSAVIDAVASNLSVLRSPTVMRLEGGELWGFEGVNETVGSCYGSCQHVYNYAYALPYLFPRLERSLRRVNIGYAMDENGGTAFRVSLPLGDPSATPHACVDGQMGEVIKCYREWKLSGDVDFLREVAPAAFRMLEYAWSEKNPDGWDRDRDGILEGRQHHTLDMELFGPSSWLESVYLLALDCSAEMADALGEHERAHDYRALYENGRRFLNESLYNGRYFCQRIDLDDRTVCERYDAMQYWNDEAGEIKYQVGDGSVIDQMLGEWHAHLVGRPMLFDPKKKATALTALYENNHKSSMRGVVNMWRNFALNDESGTVICSYPDGVRVPRIPIPYCEECMTGFEYALGGLMIAEGMHREGERIVSAVRERYDGVHRNPYNEIECGSNYVRSMASFALLPLYAGMAYDMSRSYLGFAPITPGDGRYLFSVGEGYGVVEYKADTAMVILLGGRLSLASVSFGRAITVLSVDGREVPFSYEDGCAIFDKTAIGDRLVALLR